MYFDISRVVKLFLERSLSLKESDITSELLFVAILSSSRPCVLDVEDEVLRCKLKDFIDSRRIELYVGPLCSVI